MKTCGNVNPLSGFDTNEVAAERANARKEKVVLNDDIPIYCIRNKKTRIPLRISIFSNDDAEFANSCGARFELSPYDTTIYTTTNREIAGKALLKNPNWYNACLDFPEWPKQFNPEDYEVFQLTSLY